MYRDLNLRAEVISSLLGRTVKPYDSTKCQTTANILTIEDFNLLNLIGHSTFTERTISQRGASILDVVPLHNLIGKEQVYAENFFLKEEQFFYTAYDYDFTNLSDSAECSRGDEPYQRPKGWYRMALKVKGLYPDGDTWLGPNGWRSHSVPGEWPVSYHGTSLDGAKCIIDSHYKAGDRALYGRGIYSTPNVQVAERHYATTFKSETTGKSYKLVLQNRINPQRREICKRREYWLIPVPEGTSTEEEKKIVNDSIRPYGILIKEIPNNDCIVQ